MIARERTLFAVRLSLFARNLMRGLRYVRLPRQTESRLVIVTTVENHLSCSYLAKSEQRRAAHARRTMRCCHVASHTSRTCNESRRQQAYLVGPRHLSHRDEGRRDNVCRSLGNE